MMFNRKVFIRVIEVILCIACFTALRVTDDESRRVFHYLRNRSRDWSLITNVTWGTIGAAVATTTCGGYVIITAGLLIATVTGELSGKLTEMFFLGLGVLLFTVIGGLSLFSIESVPYELVDNAVILGVLCLITALVFIIDLLMTTPAVKKKHDGTQTIVNSDTSVKPVTTMTTMTIEKEPKISKNNGSTQSLDDDKRGNVNEAFEKVDRRGRGDQDVPSSEPVQPRKVDVSVSAESINFHDRDIKFIDAERQASGYLNNRNSRKDDRDEERIFYKGQEIILRPPDEIDTPRFPNTRDTMTDPVFPKLMNPSVKIMRVDRDVEDSFDNHGRFSDSSQYDNVPTRIAPGILKHGYTFTSPNRNHRGMDRNRDEIEALEEWVGVLRKSTTGTQTGPSSPTDPGYVRHTASNWPREFKSQTPGSSPDRITR